MPYLIRLLCLTFACFFLLHAAIGAAIAALNPRILRMAGRMNARRAADFLFYIRMLPSSFAFLVVAAVCMPSYFPAGAGGGVGRRGSDLFCGGCARSGSCRDLARQRPSRDCGLGSVFAPVPALC